MELLIFFMSMFIFLMGMASAREMGYMIRIPHAPWQKELRAKPPIPTLPEYSRSRRQLEEEALAAFELELNPPKPPAPPIEFISGYTGGENVTPTKYIDMMFGSGYTIRSHPTQRHIKTPGFESGGLAMYTPPIGQLPVGEYKRTSENYELSRLMNTQIKLEKKNKELERMISELTARTPNSPFYSHVAHSAYNGYRDRVRRQLNIPSSQRATSFEEWLRSDYERYDDYLSR